MLRPAPRSFGAVLHAQELRQPPVPQSAYAAVVASEVAIIPALSTQIDRLGAVVGDHFGRHRDAEIYTSLPGLGVILAAQIPDDPRKFGDAPDRYTDAKARKNYAGTSPITRASGTKKIVLARYACNRRLGDALQQWVSSRCADHPGHAPTTCSSAPATSATKQPCASSPTARSAFSTAASRQGLTTTSTPPGHTFCRPLLNTARTWGVCR